MKILPTQAYTSISGWLAAGTGTGTASAKIAKDNGFLDWVDDNTLRIGLACTVITAVFYALAKILEMTLNLLKHLSKRKTKD